MKVKDELASFDFLFRKLKKEEESLAKKAIANKEPWPANVLYPACQFFVGYANVYTLSDKTGNIFYVGCTIKPVEKRLAAHFVDASGVNALGNILKANLIVALNYEVVATVIDKMLVTGKKASAALSKAGKLELYWINKYLEMGYPLVNRENRNLRPLKKQTIAAA